MRVVARWRSARLPHFHTEAVSLTGPRAENQDNYLIIAPTSDGSASVRWLKDGELTEDIHPHWPVRWIRMAVLDGMGGHRNGREIAEAAVDALRALPPCPTMLKQRRATLDLHDHLQRQFSTGQANSPGTTLIWVEVDRFHRRCHLAHVGDSRAWLGIGDTWRSLTRDHTLTEFDFRDGRIDSTAYATERNRRDQRIAQALGHGAWGIHTDGKGYETFGFAPEIRLDAASELPPDMEDHADSRTLDLPWSAPLLLATDGLWSGAERELPSPTEVTRAGTIRALAQETLNAGGADNTTVVIGFFDPEHVV